MPGRPPFPRADKRGIAGSPHGFWVHQITVGGGAFTCLTKFWSRIGCITPSRPFEGPRVRGGLLPCIPGALLPIFTIQITLARRRFTPPRIAG